MNNDPEEKPVIHPDIDCVLLKDALADYQIKHQFAPGDPIRQKRRFMHYNLDPRAVILFIDYIDEPIMDEYGCFESAHVLTMAGNKNPAFVLVDPRLFEPYPADELSIKPAPKKRHDPPKMRRK